MAYNIDKFKRLLRVWVFIIENEGTTISKASSTLGLNKTTLSNDLNVLERLGVVKRIEVKGPPRRNEVWLTEKGKKLVKHVLAIYNELLKP
ncbi:MAG: hypothetical protein DRN49_01310 [Thaumarchaeota archaeon]|nr:MAG: hypothetical protein DRN49_01310 [Nitrososphaerota archaeon]